ncbi:MAG: hypothetical protein RLZZ574_1190, partial [Cyanobacteriota bacterium]
NNRLITKWVKFWENAVAKQGIAAKNRIQEKVILGPKRSRIMPMMILAGIVNARLQIARVLIWSGVRLSSLPIVVAKGAKLNQQTKVKKNAIHVMWSILYFP